MEWALVNELRTKAEKSGTVGICPGCAGEVRAKCGEIVSWHWAHINADCDPWSEPETEWHRKWKGYFPADWQEVTKPPHRADVAGPDGVLEIQRSGISPEEIREREQFYGRMAWLLNGHDFWENLEWIKAAGDYHEFRWKHARKTWITASRTIFIDTPLGLFRVKNIKDGSWKVICGSFVKAASLVQALDTSGKAKASMELLLYDSLAESARDEFFAKADELNNLYLRYKSLYSNMHGYTPPPRWRDWMTAHQFICKVDSACVKSFFDYYRHQIVYIEQLLARKKEKERHEAEMRTLLERQKAERRAEIQRKQAEAHKMQQAINKAANESIAAALMAKGVKA
jgi:competence CoiA-like predicted nuclease